MASEGAARLVKDTGRRVAARAARFVRKRGVPLSAADRHMRSIRNRHVGRSGVMVGMGPSLRVDDLARLGDRISFACNKIFLAFEETDWRPDYYVVADPLVAQQHAERIHEVTVPKFASHWCKPYLADDPGVTFFHAGVGRECQFSTNAVYGLGAGHTVMFEAAQLAFWMGIRDATFIGVDFSFDLEKSSMTDVAGRPAIVDSGSDSNHFHPDYRAEGEIWRPPNLHEMWQSFAAAGEAYRNAGGRLTNASRRTMLDALEREDFETVFPAPDVE